MKIPTEDFIDVTLAISDTYGDDIRGGNGGDKVDKGDWGGGAPSPPSITQVLSSYFSYHHSEMSRVIH